jgi:hypothetical protein
LGAGWRLAWLAALVCYAGHAIRTLLWRGLRLPARLPARWRLPWATNARRRCVRSKLHQLTRSGAPVVPASTCTEANRHADAASCRSSGKSAMSDHVALKYVVPAVGVAVANAMFASPFIAVLKVRREKALGVGCSSTGRDPRLFARSPRTPAVQPAPLARCRIALHAAGPQPPAPGAHNGQLRRLDHLRQARRRCRLCCGPPGSCACCACPAGGAACRCPAHLAAAPPTLCAQAASSPTTLCSWATCPAS